MIWKGAAKLLGAGVAAASLLAGASSAQDEGRVESAQLISEGSGGFSELSNAQSGPRSDTSETMPSDLAQAVRRSLTEEVLTIRSVPGSAGEWCAANPAARVRMSWSTRGISIGAATVGGATPPLTLELATLERGGETLPLTGGTVTTTQHRFEVDRGSLTEWFVNDSLGLEHGFTIHESGSSAAEDAPLRLVLTVGGGYTARVQPGGDLVHLGKDGDSPTINYGGLRAWDAAGSEIATRFEAEGDQLAIDIDDAHAAYPITVDPWVWIETTEIGASDSAPGVAFGEFGVTVAIDGDRAIVGAPKFPSYLYYLYAGAAYIYKRDNGVWTQETKLYAGDGEDGDRFGQAVDIEQDVVLIGAAYDKINGVALRGSAYVFAHDAGTWALETKLYEESPGDVKTFGSAVSIDNGAFLIGAPGSDTHAGKAFVYRQTGSVWNRTAVLTASDADQLDYFGRSLCLDDRYAVIGANGNADMGTLTGSAYIFYLDPTTNTWGEQAKILPADITQGAQLGESVYLSGDTALLGAFNAPTYGAAYVYVRSGTTWSQQARLEPDNIHTSIRGFGEGVAIQGDRALIGAGGMGTVGAAFFFERSGTTWTQVSKIVASDGVPADHFGHAVALDGDTALIGASKGQYPSTGAVDAGSAYIFDRVWGDAAACSWYCGAGTNLDTYTITDEFVLGDTYRGTVGFSAPNLGAVVAGYLGRLTFAIWGQQGLVDITKPEVMGLPSAFGASPVTITWDVPNDHAYCGFHIFTQAATVGGGVINLTCAYDCTVGY